MLKRNVLGVVYLEDATAEEIMEEIDRMNKNELAKMRMEDLSDTITDVLEKLKNGMTNENLHKDKSNTPGSLRFIRPTTYPVMSVQDMDDNVINCFNWAVKKSTSESRAIHKKLYDLEKKILNDYKLSEEDLDKAIPEIESILEKIQKSKEAAKPTEEEMQRDKELTLAIAILYRVAHKDPLIKELINKDSSMEEARLKEFLDKTIHILEEPFRVTLFEDIRINRNLITKDLEILMHGIVTPFIRACFEYCNKFKGGKSYIISDIDIDHRLKPMVKKYIAEYKSESDKELIEEIYVLKSYMKIVFDKLNLKSDVLIHSTVNIPTPLHDDIKNDMKQNLVEEINKGTLNELGVSKIKKLIDMVPTFVNGVVKYNNISDSSKDDEKFIRFMVAHIKVWVTLNEKD